MASFNTNTELKIVDKIQVSAPARSLPNKTLSLNYFDMPWFACVHMQSLFFYEYTHSTSHFMENTLPILKQSLSLTLQHFFPLAAKLMCPPPPLHPYILYTDGDSVSLTITESTTDFNHLIANYPRDIKLLHPFVAHLPPSTLSSDGVRVLPILALKVTLFPNRGICIGFVHNHVAADGCAFMHFVRFWSSVCNSKGDPSFLDDVSQRPFHDKDVIKDPSGCNDMALKGYWNWVSSWRENNGPGEEMTTADKVRATFILTRAQLMKLKLWLTSECNNNSNDVEEVQVSTFVATCAIMWICMIKSQEGEKLSGNGSNNEDNKFYYFLFAVDCRSRIEFPLPVTYFGNCLAPGVVRAKKGELMAEKGIVTATKVIARKVKEIENGGAMKEVEKGPSNLEEMFRSGTHVGISGSPKLRVYNMDFGWGRPLKIEYIHIDNGGSLSLIESRDEAGAMEVSLVLSKEQMKAFTANLEESISAFK